jgi:3-oxoacyl-[acyl-carrier-protein] synthase II
VQRGTIHPSLNVDRLDPVFTLDVARTLRKMEKRVALKTSAGFGGHDAAIVLAG